MTAKTLNPPSYRHHKARNQAFVQFQGCRYYLGTYGTEKSRERYRRFLAEVWTRPEIPRPQITPGTTITVVELAAAFWTWASEYYTKDGVPTSQPHLVKAALHAVRELYGTMPAAQFGPLCLEAVQQRLVDEGKSRGYVNHLVRISRQVFKWDVSKQIVPVTVYQALLTVPGLKKGRTTAREPKPIGPVEDVVVEATLPYLPEVVADMVRLQRLTGCRPGEVCSMRPGDIDRTTDPWTYRPVSHKTQHLGKARTIYIGPKAQEVLRSYLLRPADSFCFSPAESEARRKAEMRERRRTRVQPSQLNRRKKRPKRPLSDHYVKNAYRLAVHRAVDRTNRAAAKAAAERGEEAPVPVPHWHPNQLRHSAATEIRRLFGLEAAQVALRHSRADVTQVYAERDMKLAAEIARKIG